ncbi:nuclear pore protein [Diplodia corticola]|uniref:Nuclear pore protein n=1 Tax=Diplodia corticola TaxID=236234 RepID=A0A1J9QWE6_9PEZI|nr:nuclear pore protein [Diplodia corticola]OJD32752.1 nuclear pore protein [Diplodia corticola]
MAKRKSKARGPTVTYFDPDGDTRLVLNEGEADEKTFVVSWKTVSAFCDSWDRMLNPDGHPGDASHKCLISLPDDDWRGLQIILNIAHQNFDRVPQDISFRDLVAVAVLTEKYGATRLVPPWTKKWLRQWRKRANQSGYEEWLYVAWAFGQDRAFKTGTKRLVLEYGGLLDGTMLKSDEETIDLIVNPRHFPPGIIESIHFVRDMILDSILEDVYEVLNQYVLPTCQVGGPAGRACNAMVCGSLFSQLRKLGLWPDKITARKTLWSPKELVQKLRAVKVMTPSKEYKIVGDSEDHSSCAPIQQKFREIIDMWYNSEVAESAVREHHIGHMRRKREELLGINSSNGRKRKWGESFEQLAQEESSAAGEANVAQMDQEVDEQEGEESTGDDQYGEDESSNEVIKEEDENSNEVIKEEDGHNGEYWSFSEYSRSPVGDDDRDGGSQEDNLMYVKKEDEEDY